jgi:hypothetical protein
MKTLTCKRCVRILKSIPLKLGIMAFLRILALVILLQVDLVSGDEPETVYEGCYEIKNTSIFAWSSIFNVGDYHWLCDPIH